MVNSTSEHDIRAIWNAIGVKAAIAEIQEHNKRITFYAEVPREKRQYPEKFKSLIEERGAKILGNINYCSAGVSRAAAAYWSVEKGTGEKFYFQPDNFNKDVIKHIEKLKSSPEYEPCTKTFEHRDDGGYSSIEHEGEGDSIAGHKRHRFHDHDSLLKQSKKVTRHQGTTSSFIQTVQEGGADKNNAELARKIDQLLEEQRLTREENRQILQFITVQGGTLDGIARRQAETQQDIQGIANSQNETSRTIHEIASNHAKTDQQIQGMTLGFGQMSDDIQKIAENHIDTAFLASNLEITTKERDESRHTVRSQAGKMGAVTMKLNAVQRENDELNADKEQSITHRDVIEEVVDRVSKQVRKHVQRSEKRLASLLDAKDQPLGDPKDNYPYDQFTQDERILEYMSVLDNTYKLAAPMEKRQDILHIDDFPVAAMSRRFHCDLAAILTNPQNICNLAKSPAKHRMDLFMLSGTMTHKDSLDLMVGSFRTIYKWCCERTGEPFIEDSTEYQMMDNPFCSLEVRTKFIFSSFSPCNHCKTGKKLGAGSSTKGIWVQQICQIAL